MKYLTDAWTLFISASCSSFLLQCDIAKILLTLKLSEGHCMGLIKFIICKSQQALLSIFVGNETLNHHLTSHLYKIHDVHNNV